MFVFIICAIISTILLRFLRNLVVARRFKRQYCEDFVPNFGKAEDEKFIQVNKERKERWKKKLEEHYANEAKVDPKDRINNFEKEVRYTKAKKALEHKYPLQKRSMFEGAFALADMMKAERERKILLADLRKKMFEDVPKKGTGKSATKNSNPNNPNNTNGENGSKSKPPEPTLRKRKVCKEDLEEMPSN